MSVDAFRKITHGSVWVEKESDEEVIVEEAMVARDGTLIVNDGESYESAQKFVETHERVQ